MDNPPLRVLSLFSGGAGLDLGFQLAVPRSRVVAYVEAEAFAAAVLLARQEAGVLDAAPVWCGDIRAFDGKPWAGSVDCVIGGWPCPPFSAAGKGLGADDPRDMWPEVYRILKEIRPALFFGENVGGFAGHPDGLVRSIRDLRELGYRSAATLVTASEVGASHKRERVFILGSSEILADTYGQQWCPDYGQSDAQTDGGHNIRGILPLFPPGPGELERWAEILAVYPELAPAVKCDVRSLPHGLAPNGATRRGWLRALGNGVQPLSASLAFSLLAARLFGERD